jgi:hypothetical protein
MHQTPQYYIDLLERSGPDNIPECEKALKEIKEILKSMEKGLQMLQKLSRPPEKKVLDNQKRFQQLEKSFENLIIISKN